MLWSPLAGDNKVHIHRRGAVQRVMATIVFLPATSKAQARVVLASQFVCELCRFFVSERFQKVDLTQISRFSGFSFFLLASIR